VTKFAHHADLFWTLKRRAVCRELQKDYTALSDRMINWNMEVKAKNCEVVHIWKNKPSFMMGFIMMGSKMTITAQE